MGPLQRLLIRANRRLTWRRRCWWAAVGLSIAAVGLAACRTLSAPAWIWLALPLGMLPGIGVRRLPDQLVADGLDRVLRSRELLGTAIRLLPTDTSAPANWLRTQADAYVDGLGDQSILPLRRRPARWIVVPLGLTVISITAVELFVRYEFESVLSDFTPESRLLGQADESAQDKDLLSAKPSTPVPADSTPAGPEQAAGPTITWTNLEISLGAPTRAGTGRASGRGSQSRAGDGSSRSEVSPPAESAPTAEGLSPDAGDPVGQSSVASNSDDGGAVGSDTADRAQVEGKPRDVRPIFDSTRSQAESLAADQRLAGSLPDRYHPVARAYFQDR